MHQGSGYGVYGETTGAGYGVVGSSPSPGYAGYFNGRVAVTGLLSKGGGSFKIDHPLDPANNSLPLLCRIAGYDEHLQRQRHPAGEGFATVILPDWFQALNQEFRYQLTPIGQFAQAIVAEEIQGNQFPFNRQAGG